jgi:hypothetical protein
MSFDIWGAGPDEKYGWHNGGPPPADAVKDKQTWDNITSW